MTVSLYLCKRSRLLRDGTSQIIIMSAVPRHIRRGKAERGSGGKGGGAEEGGGGRQRKGAPIQASWVL